MFYSMYFQQHSSHIQKRAIEKSCVLRFSTMISARILKWISLFLYCLSQWTACEIKGNDIPTALNDNFMTFFCLQSFLFQVENCNICTQCIFVFYICISSLWIWKLTQKINLILLPVVYGYGFFFFFPILE